MNEWNLPTDKTIILLVILFKIVWKIWNRASPIKLVEEKEKVLDIIHKKRKEKELQPDIYGTEICTLYENESGIIDVSLMASYSGPYTITSLKGKSISGYKLSSADYTAAEKKYQAE